MAIVLCIGPMNKEHDFIELDSSDHTWPNFICMSYTDYKTFQQLNSLLNTHLLAVRDTCVELTPELYRLLLATNHKSITTAIAYVFSKWKDTPIYIYFA